MARKMKDSGIEWIGEIPEGWEVTKLKYLSTFPIEKNAHTDSPYIGLENIESWTGKYVSSDSQYDKSQALTFFENNILFGKLRPYLAKVFCASNDGCCSSEFCILNFSSSVNIRYFWNLLISPTFIDHVTKSTYGTKMPRANTDFIKNICVPVPPRIEQDRIALYLDATSAKIDSLISETRSSIEEYKKLKQAVITQAVTKGVRGEREMKDSGVEWIGEIPKEWRKTQLRHCAAIKSGITLGKSYSKDTILIERPYLRVANVQGGYVDLNDLATIEVTPDEDLKYRLHSGDVLMTEGGDRDKLGRGCVWHGEIEPCLHQNHVFAVQTNETILLPEFLEYLTASDVGRSYFDVTAIKTTNLACTSSSKVLAFTIPLPPIEEQIEIVSFIKKRSLELNKLIMKKELLVQELEHYKKSLIYEVVTGKREV